MPAMNISGFSEPPYRLMPETPHTFDPGTQLDTPKPSKLHSGPVIALFVLGSLVVVIGSIYAYIYFTKINPQRSRARKYMDQSQEDDGGAQGTHLFLFRRS